MIIIDEFAEILLFLVLLLNALLKLFEFSNELLFSFVLLLSTHEQLLCVDLSSDFLLVVKRFLNNLMIKLSTDFKDCFRDRIISILDFVNSALME